jgi:Cu/Zn superoxide dismutase
VYLGIQLKGGGAGRILDNDLEMPLYNHFYFTAYFRSNNKAPYSGAFSIKTVSVSKNVKKIGNIRKGYRVMKKLLAGLLVASLLVGGFSYAYNAVNPSIQLTNARGEPMGNIILQKESNGVKISIQAFNLTPGEHGFHIHSQAITDYDFKTAGGHFNPDGKKHGLNSSEGHHLGDLPNLEVGADGKVSAVFHITGITLEKDVVNSIARKSFIIHAGPDDYVSDPAGNSGDRVAGGNIDY